MKPGDSGEHHRFIEKWWKHIFFMATGMSAVGIVIWSLTSEFFVTRGEFTKSEIAKVETTAKIEARLSQVQETLQENKNAVKEQSSVMKDMTEALTGLKIRIIQIDNRQRRTGE